MKRAFAAIALLAAALSFGAARAHADSVVFGVNDDAGKYENGVGPFWSTLTRVGLASDTITLRWNEETETGFVGSEQTFLANSLAAAAAKRRQRLARRLPAPRRCLRRAQGGRRLDHGVGPRSLAARQPGADGRLEPPGDEPRRLARLPRAVVPLERTHEAADGRRRPVSVSIPQNLAFEAGYGDPTAFSVANQPRAYGAFYTAFNGTAQPTIGPGREPVSLNEVGAQTVSDGHAGYTGSETQGYGEAGDVQADEDQEVQEVAAH